MGELTTALTEYFMDSGSTRMSRPVIVFDLDDTIVASGIIRMDHDNAWVKIGRRKVYVRLRPGLKDMMKTALEYFNVYFFTAGVKEYGNAVIDMIAPETPAKNRFFPDSCINYCGYMVKDLNLVKRPMNEILLVDDMEGSALMQPENLVKISPWSGNSDDRVLADELTPALKAVADEADLRLAFRAYVMKEKFANLETYSFEE